ncbi:unnamed protein product [Aphanomyces euteiches]
MTYPDLAFQINLMCVQLLTVIQEIALMASNESTGLTSNVDRKEYTPLLETTATSVAGAVDSRPLVQVIGSLRASLDIESSNKDLDSIDSLTHLLTIVRVLRETREELERLDAKKREDKWSVSFDAEAHAKLLLFAEKEYEDLVKNAIKYDIADILVHMISHNIHDEASHDLLNELSSGGFIFVQNALYYASADHLDAFLNYLSDHLQRDPANTLDIFQQLCVCHHSLWQAVMRAPIRDGPSFIEVILNRIEAFSLNSVSKEDGATLIAYMDFLSEACQGPCLDNQVLISGASQALSSVRDILMDSIQLEPTVDDQVYINIQRSAAEVILTLMEGREDDVVHERLMVFFPVAAVMDRLQAHYHTIQERLYSPSHRSFMEHTVNLTKSLIHSESKDEAQRRMREFLASINLLRIATHLLNDKHANDVTPPGPEFTIFRSQWQEMVTNSKVHDALVFFQEQLISVEIARGARTFTSYFLRPHMAEYFNDSLKTKLIDKMDIGSEEALDVLASEVAKDVEEELTVIQHLNKNPFYSLMNNWNVWLRKNMLRLCFYINFVMLLCVRVDNSTMVDIKSANMHSGLWVVGVLGFVLLGFCSVLWFYFLLTTLCFNYCKQQASPSKLSFTTSSEYWSDTFQAFAPFGVYLEFFIAVFAVVYYMEMFSTTAAAIFGFAVLYLLGLFLSGIRVSSGLYRFTVNSDVGARTNFMLNMLSFWFNVIYDTLVATDVLIFGFYTLCAICGLGLSIPSVTEYFESGPWGLMFFGFPLVDILATNEELRFVATAMKTNLGKLGVTTIFGAIMIYIFSLMGFFLLQSELTSDSVNHCGTLLQCYSTYIRYGLLSGGGIGDYISSTLNNELPLDQPDRYFERLVYDMAFFVVVITLFLNMIQGIIIDAFTTVREQAETKAALIRERCLVCNRARNAIELEGVELGLLYNFSRHTQVEHNLFHYFFYIQSVTSKEAKELNGIESYVVEKLKTKDMSWIPRV